MRPSLAQRLAGAALFVALTTAMPAAAHHDAEMVQRGAVSIEVEVEGSGPSIVLLPSLGRGQEDFDAIAPLLAAAGFRVLRPEPRGIGHSTPLAAGETLHDMAADIAAVIERYDAAPVLVVGHAAGNWPARMLAHDRPDLVRGVAMLAAVVGTEVDPAIRRSITASFDLSLSDAARLEHLRRAYFAPGHDARVWLPGWHPEVSRAQRAATEATTDRAWLRVAERRPTLYVFAAADTIVPNMDEATLRAALGPQVTMVTVRDAGHALVPEQPEATAAALIGFARTLFAPR